MNRADPSVYFAGQALYGDDFGPEELAAWYRDEAEGFSGLDHDDARSPVYHFHALNHLTGFAYLPRDRRFDQALGVGSAFAEEFAPLASRIGMLTVLDPSATFVRDRVHGVPARYVKPHSSGVMPFADGAFDLITCFGTLHHIPNVSRNVGEIARVLRPGGYALIREPIISMGDWREPRHGLTRHERGIPLALFRRMIADTGLRVRASRPVGFGPLAKAARIARVNIYNSRIRTLVDTSLCRLFAANTVYHRVTALQKIGPTGIAWVLHKPVSGR